VALVTAFCLELKGFYLPAHLSQGPAHFHQHLSHDLLKSPDSVAPEWGPSFPEGLPGAEALTGWRL
jgi:hypothetical protein